MDRLLLRHPMTGENNLFGKIVAMRPHRFGEAGIDRLADIVISAVEEEYGHGQSPVRLGLFAIGGIGAAVHVPTVGAEEAVSLECGDVAVFVLFGQHGGIARDVRRAILWAEPAAVGADESAARRLALAARIASAK